MTNELLSIRANFVIDGADKTNQTHLTKAVKDFVDGYQPAIGRVSGIQYMVEDMVIERPDDLTKKDLLISISRLLSCISEKDDHTRFRHVCMPALKLLKKSQELAEH